MIDDFTAVDATNVLSAGSELKLDVLNITTAGAHGTTNVAAGNKGSNYECYRDSKMDSVLLWLR